MRYKQKKKFPKKKNYNGHSYRKKCLLLFITDVNFFKSKKGRIDQTTVNKTSLETRSTSRQFNL